MNLGYTIIPKSSKVERVISNFELEGFSLNTEEMDKINSFNKFDQKQYIELDNEWINNTIGIEKFAKLLEKGLLFDKNYEL